MPLTESFGARIAARPGQSLAALAPAALDALVLKEKLVLLRGFGAQSPDAFLAWCRAFPGRRVLEWEFGAVMEMKERLDPQNYLFSRERVPFHWDGAFHRVPSFLMFYCVSAPLPGAGGETLFCDTGRVWAAASPEEKASLSLVELTYETAKLAHYGGSITAPLVQRHPGTGKPILRYAEPVETALNPVSMKVSGIPESEHEAFIAAMRERIYDPAFGYEHAWQAGDVLIADNHALIHGRKAFELDCPRHLRRIQLI